MLAPEIEDCSNQKTGQASITEATNQTACFTGSEWEKLHTEMNLTSICVCVLLDFYSCKDQF